MIDLRLIRHFEAVYRLKSFSKAADELNLTHSAVTKSIKTLETDWGTKLFHRTTRTVTPTEAGKRLYPMALDLFGFAQNVKDQTIRGAPHLTIVSGPAALETLVQPAILRFRDQYPKTKITAQTLSPEHAVEELVQRRAHILVYHSDSISGLPQLNRLTVTEVVEEPYVMVFRPEHPVRRTDLSLNTVAQFDWAVAGYDSLFEANLPRDIQATLTQNNFPKYRLLSQSACIDLAVRADIITTLPARLAEKYIAEGTLVSAQHPAEFSFKVSAATLLDASTEPTVQTFINALKVIRANPDND